MRESERARFCVFEEVKSRPYSIPVGIAALEEGEEKEAFCKGAFYAAERDPLPRTPHPFNRERYPPQSPSGGESNQDSLSVYL